MKKYVFIGLMLVSFSSFAENVYRLETKMGDRVFADVLVIDSYGPQSFEGSLTVPGVFTSKIEKATMVDLYDGKKLNFDINVHENNQDYVVHYSLSVRASVNYLSGELSQHGQVIAQITGKQIYGEKK